MVVVTPGTGWVVGVVEGLDADVGLDQGVKTAHVDDLEDHFDEVAVGVEVHVMEDPLVAAGGVQGHLPHRAGDHQCSDQWAD